jgi:hypothetical protein
MNGRDMALLLSGHGGNGRRPSRQQEACAMSDVWTVKDSSGRLLPQFVGASRLDVGRKVVPERYDAFRLHVSPSYREVFERTLHRVLEREAWQIVRVKDRRISGHESEAAARFCLNAQ